VQLCDVSSHSAIIRSSPSKILRTGIKNACRIWAGNRYRWDIKETERGTVNWVHLDRIESKRRLGRHGDIP
jgi:uncharacterized SAM-binding protein YcdF (DUF218 family)